MAILLDSFGDMGDEEIKLPSGFPDFFKKYIEPHKEQNPTKSNYYNNFRIPINRKK